LHHELKSCRTPLAVLWQLSSMCLLFFLFILILLVLFFIFLFLVFVLLF
jgi:hypothetical protein